MDHPPFNESYFRTQLRTSWLGSDFIFLEEAASTNTFLKTCENDRFSHGAVVLADHQTVGRGQYSRSWHSEPRANLTFTIGLRPASAERLPLLTLSVADAVRQCVADQIGGDAKIKWPNDIFICDKKVSGVLTESVFVGKELHRLLIGVGINVLQSKFPGALGDEATSLVQHVPKTPSREEFLAQLLSRIEYAVARWTKHDPELHKAISRNLAGYGEWCGVRINGKQSAQPMKFLGVNRDGCCLLLNEELDVNTFSHEQIRIFPAGSERSATADESID